MEPGKETSEFSLTKLVVIGGFITTLAGAVLEVLQGQHVLDGAPWAPAVLMVVGMAASLFKALGYTKGRNALKAEEIATKGTVQVAALIPLVKEAVQLAQEAKASASPQLPPPPTP